MTNRRRAVRRQTNSGRRRSTSGKSVKNPGHSNGRWLPTAVQQAQSNKPLLSHADIRNLQGSLGNKAVLRMIAANKKTKSRDVTSNFESTIQRAQGDGQALSPRVRKKMENQFDADLSSVEIHDDVRSDRLNEKIGARAFTSGPQIFFKRGHYQPETSPGKRLLAHELTHVIQQRAAGMETGKVVHRNSLSDKNLTISPTAERPLIQGSFFKNLGKKIGNFAGKVFKGVKNAFKFVRNRLKQSCGGKIDAKESKNILEQAFEGKKFKVDRIKVVDEAGIKKAWDKIYGEGSYDGSNGKEADGPLEGFTAPDNTIYINSSAQEVDTMPHEILHRHENGAVINKMGENFNEGFTEYLTQKAVSAMGYKPTSSYPDDLAVVKKLVPIIGGDKVLENAYFDGDLDTLKKALDKKKGKGSYKLLVGAMKAGNYADANKILDAKDKK